MSELLLEGRPLAIFPVRNKKPACTHGFKDAVSDPELIDVLFRAYPTARQIGVATGEINDLDVLDIDAHRGGNKFWEENRHRIPLTRTHQTPHGGRHLLFRHAPGLRCSTDRIAPGIEVKADGGSFVWHPAQFYPFTDAPVADWPTWLLELARAKQHRHKVPFPPIDPEGKGASQNIVGERSPIFRDAPSPYGVQPTRNLRLRTSHIMSVLQTAKPGDGRNAKLYWAACRFGELIAEGSVPREIAEFMLLGAARYNGHVAKHGADQTMATIRSGLDRVLSTQEEAP
jgi:hypothetical protein